MIETSHISKRYIIPHEKKMTAVETAIGYLKHTVTYEPFFALQDITFRVESGEAVGVMGKNGSGKTTLLKILSGIISPSEGTYSLKGSVAPFFSLGVGFHHELTARENIYLYGALLGIPRERITEREKTIFAFAGVERFRDTKLKHFSSGMVSRLAFALMIQTDSDIFLLDELFSTGDKDFVPQSLSVLEAYKNKGKTIVLASHDLDLLNRHCSRSMLLHEGRLIDFGKTEEVIQHYIKL